MKLINFTTLFIMYTETSHPRYGLRVAPEPGIEIGTTSVPGMRTQRTEREKLKKIGREIYITEGRFI